MLSRESIKYLFCGIVTLFLHLFVLTNKQYDGNENLMLLFLLALNIVLLVLFNFKLFKNSKADFGISFWLISILMTFLSLENVFFNKFGLLFKVLHLVELLLFLFFISKQKNVDS